MNETRGSGGVSARPLVLLTLRSGTGERERGARGQRNQLKRYNGPTHCIHAAVYRVLVKKRFILSKLYLSNPLLYFLSKLRQKVFLIFILVFSIKIK